LGFAVATKHYLREEEGRNYEDLKYLISDIPEFEPIGDQDSTKNKIRENLNFGKKLKKLSLRVFKSKVKPHQRKKGTPAPVDPNLPLEITLYLSSFIKSREKQGKASGPAAGSMYSSLSIMIDCLTQLEGILRTPVPLAYAIHLSQTVWIYCLSLSFQLVKTFHYITIPTVFLATMVLMGINR
jgi:putative membrane protein